MGRSTKGALAVLFLYLSTASFSGIRHERVTWHEKPSQNASISWTSESLDESSTIYFDTESRQGVLNNYSFQAKPYRQGKFSRGIFHRGPFYNHVRLSQLTPGHEYYFVIVSDGAVSPEYHFRTANPHDEAFQLLFGGDSRSDYEQRRKMNKLMKHIFESQDNLLALVHGGDYVYNGGNWKDWDRWLNDHKLTTSTEGRLLPVIPARGNHEYSQTLFNEVWDWPNGGKGYFASDFGALEIITLNTEVSVYGDQRNWLEKQLQTKRPIKKWIFANYHRPAYPAVKRPSSAKGAWVPLFEKHQVDLVFESDGHVYKQTAPIYQDKIDQEKGVIYVGEGGLGVKQRSPKTDQWFLQESGLSMSAHHVQLVSVNTNISYEAIDENGEGLSSLHLPAKNLNLAGSRQD